MTRRYSYAVLLLLSGCSGTGSGRSAPGSTEALIDLHTEARGGRAAIEAVHSIEYRLAIVEPTFQVDAVYRAERDGRMRVDVYADGTRVYSEGYDGERAWQLPRDAEAGQPVSEAGETALRHGLEAPGQLYGLHELAELGHRVELVGRESIDAVDYYVVRLTYADGYAADYYIHPETYLIERKRESRALHPDIAVEQLQMETRWSDCEPTAGVVRCYEERTTNLDTGEAMQSATVTKIITNPDLPPTTFTRPGAGPTDR